MKGKYDGLIHYTMAFVGGCFGLYAILTRCGNFGSAQTNNLICLVNDLLKANFYDFIIRILALLIYLSAIVLTLWLPRHCKFDLRIISIVINGICSIVSVLLPQDINPILGLYPIFFAMAFQWCCFKGIDGYVSSTVFSTNNLRQFISGLVNYLMDHDQSQLNKAKVFGKTLFGFHFGVATIYFLYLIYHQFSILFCFLPLGLVLILIFLQQIDVMTIKKSTLIKIHQ